MSSRSTCAECSLVWSVSVGAAVRCWGLSRQGGADMLWAASAGGHGWPSHSAPTVMQQLQMYRGAAVSRDLRTVRECIYDGWREHGPGSHA
jgi:hypothetical protein